MILKLTEVRKDGLHPIWVNFDQVQTFAKSIKGNNSQHDTNIKINGVTYLFVKESPDEIMSMLYPPVSTYKHGVR